MSKRGKKRVALEAARFMIDGGESEYLHAKERAMLMLGLTEQCRMPSNRKIKDCISFISREELGPDEIKRRLLEMRTIARDIMIAIDHYDPHLIGSTLSGQIRNNSDIDLHAYCDDFHVLKQELEDCGYNDIDEELVENRKGSFVHLKWLEKSYPVEVTIYAWSWRELVLNSSVTGKPMKRADLSAMKKLLQ